MSVSWPLESGHMIVLESLQLWLRHLKWGEPPELSGGEGCISNKYPYRSGVEGHVTDTLRKKWCKRRRWKGGSHKPGTPGQPPGAEEASGRFSPRAPEGVWSCQHLEFWLPGLWEDKCCCLSHQVCAMWFRQPQEMNPVITIKLEPGGKTE